MLNIQTLRYPRWIGIKHMIKYAIEEDLFLEQWIVPKGTEILVFQSNNFGWVILPKGVKTTSGYVMHKHIFKF